MMKIGLIGDAGSIHIKRWSQWLRKHGYEVHMGSTTWVSDKQMEYPEGELAYDSFCPLKLRKGFGAHMLGVITTRSWVETKKLKLVHGHYLTSGGFYARWSGAKHKIVSAWGSDIYHDAKSFTKGKLVRSAINGSDYLFADTQALCDECTKLSNGDKNIKNIMFGIDTTLFKPHNKHRNGLVFLSVRRTSAIYNPTLILMAFSSIQQETGSKLLMAKPEENSQAIYDLVDQLEIKNAVEFYEPRQYHDMPELYNRADCGISIPNTDGASVAKLEAMSCGIPLIASDIPSNREWIDNGENGVLVKNGDLADLILKMSQICDVGYGCLDAMGAKAREKVVQHAEFNEEMNKADQIYRMLLRVR